MCNYPKSPLTVAEHAPHPTSGQTSAVPGPQIRVLQAASKWFFPEWKMVTRLLVPVFCLGLGVINVACCNVIIESTGQCGSKGGEESSCDEGDSREMHIEVVEDWWNKSGS